MENEESRTVGRHYLRNRETWLRELAACHELKPMAVRVGLYLALKMNMQTRDAWPSIKTIAKETGSSQRGVISALDDLQGEGFMLIQRRRNAGNRYSLLFKWQ